ncbi:MAG TPA: ATP-binding cassette domain-containing protein, partial [Pseudonocardiaceae bacterium]
MSQPQSAQAAALPPDDLDAAVIVRDLTANDGGHEVLHGVNLTVPSGQVFALLGPKDAGKTALIEILEGYRRRSGGEVQVLGADPHDERPAVRHQPVV